MTKFTIQDCRDAVKICVREQYACQSQAMRQYWQDLEDYWRGNEKAAIRAACAPTVRPPLVENITQAIGYPDQTPCPEPTPWGTDEKRCTRCNRIWGKYETQEGGCPFKGQVE